MSNSRTGAKFWISAWMPVLLGIGIILIESTEWFGADHTSGPLRRIYEAFFGPVTGAHWQHIHLVIRKSGHFLGYGFIGLAWLRAWWMTLPHSRFLQDAVLALLGTGIMASADEFHQSFLPNRTSSVWDVLIDCSGAITLQLIVYIYMRLARPKRLARTVEVVKVSA
jgi:VanZ family protein